MLDDRRVVFVPVLAVDTCYLSPSLGKLFQVSDAVVSLVHMMWPELDCIHALVVLPLGRQVFPIYVTVPELDTLVHAQVRVVLVLQLEQGLVILYTLVIGVWEMVVV